MVTLKDIEPFHFSIEVKIDTVITKISLTRACERKNTKDMLWKQVDLLPTYNLFATLLWKIFFFLYFWVLRILEKSKV